MKDKDLILDLIRNSISLFDDEKCIKLKFDMHEENSNSPHNMYIFNKFTHLLKDEYFMYTFWKGSFYFTKNSNISDTNEMDTLTGYTTSEIIFYTILRVKYNYSHKKAENEIN